MGNGYGDVRVSRHEDMAAYDAAPPQLRWLMRNAVASWSARHLVNSFQNLRRCGHSPESIFNHFGHVITRTEGEDTIAFYGPTHPEAPVGPVRARA